MLPVLLSVKSGKSQKSTADNKCQYANISISVFTLLSFLVSQGITFCFMYTISTVW